MVRRRALLAGRRSGRMNAREPPTWTVGSPWSPVRPGGSAPPWPPSWSSAGRAWSSPTATPTPRRRPPTALGDGCDVPVTRRTGRRPLARRRSTRSSPTRAGSTYWSTTPASTARADRGVVGRGHRAGARRQPAGHHPRRPRGRPRDGRRRRDRQHLLDRRARRAPGRAAVLRDEVRCPRRHPLGRPRARRAAGSGSTPSARDRSTPP